MNKDQKKNIHDVVLGQIEDGKIKMKPKVYFVLRLIALIFSIMAVFALSLYIVSFIFFIMHASGSMLLPQFGLAGVMSLLFSLPWIMILLAAGLIVLSEVLCKKFVLVYRNPLIHSVIILVVVLGVGGALVMKASVHEDAMEYAVQDELPVLGSVYMRYAKQPHNTYMGQVIRILDDGFEMRLPPSGIIHRVIVSQGTRIQPPSVQIAEKDEVVCLGKKHDQDVIRANGIQIIQQDNKPYFYMMQQAASR